MSYYALYRKLIVATNVILNVRWSGSRRSASHYALDGIFFFPHREHSYEDNGSANLQSVDAV